MNDSILYPTEKLGCNDLSWHILSMSKQGLFGRVFQEQSNSVAPSDTTHERAFSFIDEDGEKVVQGQTCNAEKDSKSDVTIPDSFNQLKVGTSTLIVLLPPPTSRIKCFISVVSLPPCVHYYTG